MAGGGTKQGFQLHADRERPSYKFKPIKNWRLPPEKIAQLEKGNRRMKRQAAKLRKAASRVE